MAKCWFCEKNSGVPELSIKVKFHDSGRIVESVGRRIVKSYNWTHVDVPVCEECDSKMAISSRSTFGAAAAFVIPILLGFLLNTIFPEIAPIFKYVFPCSGGIIGLTLGLAIAMKFGDVDKDIKTGESVLDYPDVVNMINKPLWQIEDYYQQILDKRKESSNNS